MKTIQTLLVACAAASLCGIAAAAEPAAKDEAYEAYGQSFPGRHGCSVRTIAGRWLFATAIGRQTLPGIPPDKGITALGTMLIKRDGSISGSFDVTIEDTFFVPGVGYTGSVVINKDCTGTLSFVNELGATRTDTLAIVGFSEMLGMSQEPANLWTYQVRRVGRY